MSERRTLRVKETKEKVKPSVPKTKKKADSNKGRAIKKAKTEVNNPPGPEAANLIPEPEANSALPESETNSEIESG